MLVCFCFHGIGLNQAGKAVGALTSCHQTIFQQVKKNIAQAQKKQKEQYDKEHANPPHNRVGTMVCRLHCASWESFNEICFTGTKITDSEL